MVTIPEALTAVSTALGIAKQIRDISKGVDDALVKLQIAELTSSLADAKLGLVDADEKIQLLEREQEKLRTALKRIEDDTIVHSGQTYMKGKDGGPQGDPFCPICLADGLFIHTVKRQLPGRPHCCPKCGADLGYISSFRYDD